MTDKERRAMAFAYGRRLTCKRCKVKPGKPCATKSGGKARQDHAERFYPGWNKAADADWRPLT